MEEKHLEKLIIKSIFIDKSFAISITGIFIKDYFSDTWSSEIFDKISSHIKKFDDIPDKFVIISSFKKDSQEKVKNYFDEIDKFEFDFVKNYDWLLEHTNNYLKEKAIKKAIVESVDIIDSKGETSHIKELIEDALCKDLKVNLGLDYFGELSERLKRIINSADNRVKTYYPSLDELFNGGYPPYTLNMVVAKVHGFKSGFMTNIAARQVKNGVDVAMATLEMSEDMYAQRFDANFTNLDINRMYYNKSVRSKFIPSIKDLKADDKRGSLYIKEYPTGSASVKEFRMWLRELSMRGKQPKILYCDYLALMKPEDKSKGDMYQDGKIISEQLRALGQEFNIPIVTVAQINRTGTFLDFESLDMNSIAESYGITGTTDSLIVQGADVDDMVYKNELKWKCCKNRLGGQVGKIGKWYIDEKSLRLYDETELDLWIEDAKISGDERKINDAQPVFEETKRKRR